MASIQTLQLSSKTFFQVDTKEEKSPYLKVIETWRSMLNKCTKVGAILMDLTKTFDTLNHNLLLRKLKAYDFNTNALTFI